MMCANGNVLICERKLRTNSLENLYFLLFVSIQGTARQKNGAKNIRNSLFRRKEYEKKGFIQIK